MLRETKILLILLNVVAILAMVGLMVYAHLFVPFKASMRVTALDRAQVINEEKLKEAYPELATNLRFKLGQWIGTGGQDAANRIAVVGIVVAILNLLLLFLGFPKAETKE